MAWGSSSSPHTKCNGVSETLRKDGSSPALYALPCMLTCLSQNIDINSDHATLCPQLARSLQNLTVIQKGATDIISNGIPLPAELLANGHGSGQPETLVSEVEGGLKRVGGQGDILSGSTGVLMAWGTLWVKGEYK